VALPGRGTRSAAVKTTLLAVSAGVLVAAMVAATGLLNPAVRSFAESSNLRSDEITLPPDTRPPTLRSPAPPAGAASASAVGAVASPEDRPASGSVPLKWRVGTTDHMGDYLRARLDGTPLHA
jgi:hypothetical protein